MEIVESSGFIEIEHTADWEMHIWAPDLAGLLEQSARGMYHLMGVQTKAGYSQNHQIQITYQDEESLLVSFLSELLYLLETKNLVFDQFTWTLNKESFLVEMVGIPLTSLSKEIKAVTYHNLSIHKTSERFEANVVFDI